jgi:hypothetical protein
MPASYGLRSRPSLYPQRLRLSRAMPSVLAASLPRGLILPALLLAGAVLTTAVFWMHDIHTSDFVAGIDASSATGSVSTD